MTALVAGNYHKMAGNWRRQARRARFKVRSQKTPKAPFPQSIVLKMEEIARESQETFSKVFANHQVGIYPFFQQRSYSIGIEKTNVRSDSISQCNFHVHIYQKHYVFVMIVKLKQKFIAGEDVFNIHIPIIEATTFLDSRIS